ncbi:ABC-type Mn2+/Zn2+ transport system, permease component [Corynebacterium mustelae]|uniref:ABC-type Mn2+/Zn2+ transport system, permease component n=1 Tax=Corynebacterium mustelae TaxID=571915 RepID=A0A0G3H104_9CORY|nr:metal ABC transporter permease [Corynebacterium mustelae]AKK07091.1 ABC-type Mn2+/Zn2+ transport system, permease component [Corynebacterium mustelae]
MGSEIFTDIFTIAYLQRALIVLMILGIVGGSVGVLVNLRAMEFSVEALVHSIFPGMVVGLAIYGINGIVPGAAAVAAVAAATLTVVTKKATSEAGTAVVLTSFYGLGVVLSLSIGDYSGQLDALMFGRLLDITEIRLYQTVACSVIALTLLVLTWRQQVLCAFDRSYARSLRVKVLIIDAVLNAAIAAVVVAASSAVGVLLVIGYLIIPGAAARLLATNTSQMVVIAVGSGIIAAIIGVIAMNVDLGRQISPQAAVSLSLIVVFMAAFAVSFYRRRAC